MNRTSTTTPQSRGRTYDTSSVRLKTYLVLYYKPIYFIIKTCGYIHHHSGKTSGTSSVRQKGLLIRLTSFFLLSSSFFLIPSGEIMYGGHVTDPWDRRTNTVYLQVCTTHTTCTVCTVYCVLCTVYCVLRVLLLLYVLCTVCTVYCVLCTLYFVQCTVYCVLCTVYVVRCTVYYALCVQ